MSGLAFRKSGAEIQPLSRDTLQDRVYRQVTELILDGSIVPGEMVTVQSLADAFKVSPMPVREALRRLTAENALTVVSGRSMGIPALNRERLTDLTNVRLEIEASAAAWAAERIDKTTLEELRRHLDALERADLESAVDELAEQLARKAPSVVRATKRQVNEALEDVAPTVGAWADADLLGAAMRDPEARQAARDYLASRSKR